MEYATEVIFKLDKHGHFYFVSREFERMLQFTNEEMSGKHFTSIIHPDDLGICIETFQVLEQFGRANSPIDFRVVQKDGGYKWVTCSAVCRFDDHGDPSHIVGMAHEVTELHRVLDELRSSESALRISEEQYRCLFEALSEGAILIDKNGMVTAVNRSAEKILGLPREEILLMNALDARFNCIHEDGSDFPASSLPSMVSLKTGKPIKDVILGLKGPDQSIKWISINTEPIYYSLARELPDAVIISFTDISQAKKDREELHRNQQLLKLESERYIRATRATAEAVVDAQEKERADIGFELHDNVNQILSTSRFYLDLAVVNEPERLDLVKRSSEGLAKAVNEIRKISRSLVPASITDLGLVASIEDLVDSLIVTGKLKVEFYHIGEIEEIAGKNKLVLFRIIQEQVTNVLKHADATHLVIELVIDKAVISLSITDNGKGFENQVEKTKKGFGLYNIVNRAELLSGKVSIVSSPGKGCKLNIVLPV